MKGPESRIVASIRSFLRARPRTWHVKIWGGGVFQQAGLPDIIGCSDGLFFAFEVKVPRKTATPLQGATLRAIKRAGGIAETVTSLTQVQFVLDGKSEIRQCNVCRRRNPEWPPESWQFVNETGICPRCVARKEKSNALPGSQTTAR